MATTYKTNGFGITPEAGGTDYVTPFSTTQDRVDKVLGSTINVMGFKDLSGNFRQASGTGSFDDYAVIQAALDLAENRGGGVVFLPTGTYGISQALEVPYKVELKGEGYGTVVATQNDTDAITTKTGNNYYTAWHYWNWISNLYIAMTGSGSATENAAIRMKLAMRQAIIKNVRIFGKVGTGVISAIKFESAVEYDYMLVQNIHAEYCRSTYGAIYVDCDVFNCNTFRHINTPFCTRSFYIKGASNNYQTTIDRCSITSEDPIERDNSGGTVAPIHLVRSRNTVVRDCYFEAGNTKVWATVEDYIDYPAQSVIFEGNGDMAQYGKWHVMYLSNVQNAIDATSSQNTLKITANVGGRAGQLCWMQDAAGDWRYGYVKTSAWSNPTTTITFWPPVDSANIGVPIPGSAPVAAYFTGDNVDNHKDRYFSGLSRTTEFAYYQPKKRSDTVIHATGKPGAGITVSNNVLYCVPFNIVQACKITDVGVDVTSGNGNVRITIYYDNGKCHPGTRLLALAALDVSTTGVKLSTLTTPQMMYPGLYWFGVNFSAAAGVKEIASSFCDILGADPTNSSSIYYSQWVSQTYTGGVDPCPALTGISVNAPNVLFKMMPPMS